MVGSPLPASGEGGFVTTDLSDQFLFLLNSTTNTISVLFITAAANATLAAFSVLASSAAVAHLRDQSRRLQLPDLHHHRYSQRVHIRADLPVANVPPVTLTLVVS